MDIQQLVKVITTALRSFTVGLITRLDSQIQETEDECDTESEAEGGVERWSLRHRV
jgi:hypothetical protein